MTNIQNQIDTIVRCIAQEYKPEKIILFGSAARGDMGPDSDIDLFIIKKGSLTPQQRSDAVYDILWQLKGRPAVDVLVYTPQEIQQRLSIGDWFVKDVLEEGKVVYNAN